jgi:hypothetical protein
MMVPQNTKNRLTLRLHHSSPGHICKKVGSIYKRDTCRTIFIAALFITAKL